MPPDWLDRVIGLLDRGQSAVMITAVEISGSVPCAAGARLIVSSESAWGTIGGGNLEFLATQQARKLLAQQERRVLVQSLPLGPILSQCCGGRVRLLFERFCTRDRIALDRARRSGGMFATTVDTERYERRHYPPEAANGGLPGQAAAFGLQSDVWLEPVSALPPLVCIFGGGHVGKALARVMEVAPCETAVIDPRPEVVANLGTRCRVIGTDDPATIQQWWRPGALAVIMTHSHALDYVWTSAILKRDDFRYCGLIGSKTKRARFVRRLREDGLLDVAIDRLVCPIGIPHLATKHPGKVAISAAAEIVALIEDVAGLALHSFSTLQLKGYA